MLPCRISYMLLPDVLEVFQVASFKYLSFTFFSKTTTTFAFGRQVVNMINAWSCLSEEHEHKFL